MAGRTLSHGELDAASNRLAWRLSERGLGHGDRIAVWADTALDVLVLFGATSKLGAVFAPLNARHSVDEAREVAALARPAALVADPERAQAAAALAGAIGGPPVFVLGREALDWQAPGRDDAFVEPALAETDPHVVFFTSGSTGRPKGVVLSHRANWLRAFQGVFRDEPERSVCMFPLFHMAGFTLALSAWQTRGELALVAQPTAEALLEAVEARRANRLYCIPAVWRRVLDTPAERHDTSSLRSVDTGTSATPVELLRELMERFPEATCRVYYGSTEVGSGTALSHADLLRKPGSVGLPSPGVELRLAASGEIQLRSPFAMDGYFDDPEASAAAFDDGWFRTGDLGSLDDEGYLTIVGRLKEIIRTGGESVSPAEVEAALLTHPDVEEVAVVGVPDPSWGERVCAVVVARAGASPELADLQAHCTARLASYKKPRQLERVDALPRTAATGQVQRALLVQRILTDEAAVR